MRRKVEFRTVFTVSFVIGLLLLVVFRSNGFKFEIRSWTQGFSGPAPTPEDSIYAMLDAARAGDAQTYLDSFANPVRDQLVQVVKESSEPRFSEYLKSQNTAFQSVAISVADRPSESEVRARVEYVYANRNEVQSLYLRKEASRWKIFKVAGSDQIKTLVPFGGSVSE